MDRNPVCLIKFTEVFYLLNVTEFTLHLFLLPWISNVIWIPQPCSALPCFALFPSLWGNILCFRGVSHIFIIISRSLLAYSAMSHLNTCLSLISFQDDTDQCHFSSLRGKYFFNFSSYTFLVLIIFS